MGERLGCSKVSTLEQNLLEQIFSAVGATITVTVEPRGSSGVEMQGQWGVLTARGYFIVVRRLVSSTPSIS